MELFYREAGEGKNLVILHGLYGSSDNWVSISKELSKNNKIIMPDLRNHGNSPHSDEFSISSMTDDLKELFDKLNLNSAIIIGHSLGGKVAMNFASKYPEKTEKLIVVDIAPRNYTKDEFKERNNHSELIGMLKDVDLSKYKNRTEALEELSSFDKSGRLKFFMMKNIRREKDGSMSWKINIKAIADNLTTILNEYSVNLSNITSPTLFIKGEKSNYLTKSDFETISKKMTDVKFCTIKGATHWVHSEKPEEFLTEVINFISNETI